MNKKKVALALAAALSINGLMVTTGNVAGQKLVAHAKEARLTNPEGVSLAEVKTLNAKVESVTQDSSKRDVVTLTFPGLTNSEVKDITLNSGSGVTVSKAWDSKTGKIELTGLKDGVNNLTLTVSYNDTSKKNESYELTLKKTATEDQLSFTTNVGPATIELTGLKFGKTDLNGKTVELQKNGANLGSQKVSTSTTTSGATVKFTGIQNMNLNDVYDVVVKDENGNEITRGQFVLTAQQTPSTTAFYTNDKTGGANGISALGTSLQNNFSSTITIVPEGSSLVVKDNNKILATFDQTVSTVSTAKEEDLTKNGDLTIYGGAALKVDSTTSGVKVTIDTSKGVAPNGKANYFFPNMRVDKIDMGTASASSTPTAAAHIGDYTVTLSGAGKTVSASKDASAQLGSIAIGSTSSEVFLDATNSGLVEIKGDTGLLADFNKEIGDKFSLDYSDLSQGYQSVSAEFNVRESNLGGKLPSQWTSEMETEAKKPAVAAEAAQASTKSVVTTFSTPVSGPVVTSVIFETDKLDGQTVTGTFKKTGDKTGQLTITGNGSGASLFESCKNDLSKIVPYVTVDGSSNIVFSGTGDANSVTFDVTFKDNVPNTINWSLGQSSKISGVVKTSAYEPVDANVKVVNDKNSATGAYLDVTFSGLNIPDNSTVTVEGPNVKSIRQGTVKNNKTQIAIDKFDEDLKSGDYALKITTPGNSSETYQVGLQVVKNDIGITIKTSSSSNNGVTVEIDAFLNGKSPSTIQNGRIEYREAGSNGSWSKIDLSKDDFKEEKVTKYISGLTAGKTYEVRVVYNYKPENGQAVDVYSNTEKVTASNSPNGNGTITGDGGSTTSGTSTGSTSISVTDKNTVYGNGTVSVDLPSSIKYDSNKIPVSSGVKYKDKDGKIVTENREQYSGITAKFENGDIVVEGLVPGKEYTEISIDYTDNNGRTKTIVLKNPKLLNGTDLQKYLANVYSVVLNRQADETGYNFHLNNLSDKKVSLREFLLNMLTEKEFIEDYKTPETKIEALYNAIVNRTSDIAGRDFWVSEYNKLLKVYGSEEATLQAIADRMVNENELKELATTLGVQW